jgi:exonuclease V
MRHLPVAARPKEILAPTGKVIKPDRGVVQERERILKRGRKVHAKLEKEIHPIKIQIEATSREERWGVRILRTVTGLHTLMDSGCCRELPVFGHLEGKLVMGVIDEISKRPLSRRLNAYFDEVTASEKEATKTLQEFFLSTQESVTSASADKKQNQQQWASQEEWRKAKRKSEQASKLNSKKGKRTETKSPTKVDAKQGSLSTFFGGAPRPREPDEQKQRFGYFLEDSKTRKGQLIPPVEDQFQARMQCMLYKRLFDGLLAGAFEHNSQAKGKEAEALALDKNAKVLDVETLFTSLGLQTDVPLSEQFISDAESLLNGFNLTIQPLDPATNVKVACTLVTIGRLLRETLTALARSAQAGLFWQPPFDQASGALQSRLRLTYRRRGGNASKARRSERVASRNAKTDIGVSVAKVDIAIQSETLESAVRKEIGVDSSRDEHAVEYEILCDNGIAVPSHKDDDAKQQGTFGDLDDDSGVEELASDREKIGTVTFLHDDEQLQAYLLDALRLWNGERELRGVTLEQSWRCHQCEFRNDCEWREQKGRERLDEATRTRLAREMLDRAAKEADSQSPTSDANPTPDAQDDTINDEENLWSQFEVIADEENEW